MVCWLPGKLGCLAAWVICFAVEPVGACCVVCAVVCCCMCCDVMSLGTHVITAIPREWGGLVSI